MVYPASFHRIVLLGTQFADTFATGLTVAASGGGDMSAADDALATEISSLIATWWPANTGTVAVQLPAQAKLTSVKVNRINSAGLYEDPVTIEHVYGSPIAGGTGVIQPAQMATAVTLRTAVERGLASKGRMYLPATLGFVTALGADGRATVANAREAANAVKTLIDGINLIYATPPTGVAGRVSVMSNVGAGFIREVTGTSCGRVPDTMRSRRSKLDEAPEYDTV